MSDSGELRDVGGELTAQDLAEVDRLLQAELEQLRRDPQAFGHRPHSGQIEILTCTKRRKCIVSANRYGKTEFGMRDVLWRARGKHPYRKVPIAKQIWVGAPDFPSYERFHKPMFDQWCPAEWLISFNESKRWAKIRRVDGGVCTIFFLSYDMPRSKWQGAGVDHIWLDEEMPEDIVRECLARIVTTRGSITLTFTPVEGVGWWFDSIFDPGIKGKNNWWCFQAALAEYDELNEKEFNVGASLVPHLTREQIVEFASEYPDPDERAVRVFGKVVGRTGLVYKGFNRDTHLVKPFALPPDYEIVGAVDPGYHGFAAAIGAISPKDRCYIVKEYFSQQEPTATRFQKLMEIVRELRSEDEWFEKTPVAVFFVDTEDPQVVLELNIQAAAANEADALEGRTPVYLAFASLEQGLKARKAGFLHVQQMLHPRPYRQTPTVPRLRSDDSNIPTWEPLHERPAKGEPQLYFFDNLYSEWQGEDHFHRESRIVWEIERYSWKEPPKDSRVKPDDGDENTAGGAHAMAALRYLTMARIGPPDDREEAKDERTRDMDANERDVLQDIEELDRIQMEEMGLF